MKSFSDVVVGLNRRNEVARNKTRTLMDQLVERVLPIRAGLTPDDGAGGVINLWSGSGDVSEKFKNVTNNITIFTHVNLIIISDPNHVFQILSQLIFRL